MRVLCLGNRYPPHSEGGYEIVWQGAARALRAAGHDVQVLTSDVRAPAPAGTPEEDPGVFRELRLYWREHAFLPRLSIRARIDLERHNATVFDHHVREFAPDVVAFWSMGAISLGLIERTRRAGLPGVAFVCDDWLVYGPRADQWMRLGRWLGPLRHRVERVTELPMTIPQGPEVQWFFISRTTEREAREAGWRLARTGIASAGIDPAFLAPASERAWSGKLLYAGRIDPRKGIDTAIRAAAELVPAVTLTIDGHGQQTHREELARLAAALGISSRVHMHPPRPRSEMPALYDEHDAVLFCVRWKEPWGLVPLEAMARGRPVVASGRGGSGEYLRDGENCLLADPDRPRDVATAVRRLADDPKLRARIVEGGLATARRHTAAAFDDRIVAAVEAAGE